MGQYLQLGVLGLGGSAAYALLALGLVLIYRASGVLNFSHGALAMTGAYIFYETHIERDWPYLAALVFSVAVVAVIGAVIYLAIMRPLRNAAVLVRIIATLGVLTVLQAIATLRYSGTVITVPEALPHRVVDWGFKFSIDRLYLIGIAAIGTVVLYLFASKTRFGLATRGVAENQRTASSVGWSPDFVATVNWAVGAGLAAVAGILIIPISTLSSTSLTFVVVPALAVCLLGAFSSFPLAFLGAVILGMAQGLLTKWQGSVPGLSDALPFGVILVALITRRQAIPQRGEVVHRLPSLGRGRFNPIFVGVCLVAGILGSLYLPLEWSVALGISVIAGIIILSLVVVVGYAGQLSLAQYAMAGVGALIAAQVVTNLHWGFVAGLILGVLGAGLSGMIFGAPSLRSRGAALAIVTLGLGVAVQSVIFSNSHIAGGQFGFSVENQNFLGLTLDPLGHPRTYTIFAICWFGLSVFLICNLRRSRAGRRLIALRANERAATSLGVNVAAAKLYAFSVSAAFAGLGGVLLAFSSASIVLTQGYDSLASITAVSNAVVGGAAHVSGAVFGGELVSGGLPGGVIANHVSETNGPEYLVLIGGALVLLTMLFNPDGIAGSFAQLARKVSGRSSRRLRRPTITARTDRGAAPAPHTAPLANGTSLSAANGTSLSAINGNAPHSPRAANAPAPNTPDYTLPPAARRSDSVLRLSGLSVRFGGVHALKGVDLEIRSGEIVGLIGPNGSGKTTLIDGVTGYVKASGTVQVGDVVASDLSAYQRVRAGVTRSFQALELFDDITVEENLRAAADKQDKLGYVTALLPVRRRPMPEVVRAVVEAFDLEATLHLEPRELSYGQRRLVAIARAVATAPKFLLLDEPAAGLGAMETAELSELVTRLARDWNIGVLLIEHDVGMVLGICNRVAVLEFGEKIADGVPDEVRHDPKVIAAYLGAQTEEVIETDSAPVALGHV